MTISHKLQLFDYKAGDFKESYPENVDQFVSLARQGSVTWLNLVDLSDVALVRQVANEFSLHPLVVEAILNQQQRPKVEDFGDYLLLVLKMIFFDQTSGRITVEQVSLVVGKSYVLSFQKTPQDVFSGVRSLIKTPDSRLRKSKVDYLAYALVDAILDNYFSVLEELGEKIEGLETSLVDKPSPSIVRMVHQLRRELLLLRKAAWPLREAVAVLERSDSPLIQKSTKPYLRELYDHAVQVIDSVETYRDMVVGLLDVYLSSVSNRLNEVMKVLTIIATIFIPLTFIVGVYGMNFKYMPELNSPYGYPAIWLVIILVGGLMVYYFKKKKWL